MKYLLITSIMLYIVITSFSCNKKDPLGPQVVNSSLFFILKKNNQRLTDSILNNLKLSYYPVGTTKKYVDDFGRASEGGYDLGVLVTRNAAVPSADNGIKNFYLEYPNGTQDTLFIDYRHVTYNEAKNNNCFCYLPLVEFKYNGQAPSLDPTITQQQVYLLNKR